MTVTTIKVCAGRTFNHPYEQYSNFKFSVALDATLTEGDDPFTEVKSLQAKAEAIAEDHKSNLLRSVRELRELSEMRREMEGIEESLKRGQERLSELRKQHESLGSPLLPASTDDTLEEPDF